MTAVVEPHTQYRAPDGLTPEALTCSPVPVGWVEEVGVEAVRFRHGLQLLTDSIYL